MSGKLNWNLWFILNAFVIFRIKSASCFRTFNPNSLKNYINCYCHTLSFSSGYKVFCRLRNVKEQYENFIIIHYYVNLIDFFFSWFELTFLNSICSIYNIFYRLSNMCICVQSMCNLCASSKYRLVEELFLKINLIIIWLLSTGDM